ncbi:MAG TPA: DUF3800 domain-containing protein [Verrucomicrobiae bacterium]|jgi:hypothetical protein|nr:DUF3800 domain-containing protein [Verrucomicrobiae bacterium]
MNRPNSRENGGAGVRLYLDESGTSDPSTPEAVIGGMLINDSYRPHFEESWRILLEEFGVQPPLHMREFTPHGRLAHISSADRRRLFARVVELIHHHGIATLAAVLANQDYEAAIPLEIRNQFSVYAMCFNLIVVMNHKLAEGDYGDPIPFILDSGNPYAEHVRQAHAAAVRFQREEHFLNVGSLQFEDDSTLGALQAADVIAWGVRRRKSRKPFPAGFEPIPGIFDHGHNESPWTPELLRELAEGLVRQLAEKRAEILKEANDGEPTIN